MAKVAHGLFTLLWIAIFLQSPAKAQSIGHSSAVPDSAPAPAHVPAEQSAPPDLTKQPTLYVVGYAHLDTQWRWEYPQVIDEFLPKTMHDNFALFEKYPHYLFNFTGSNRYGMMKEYYPADFAKLKQYVAADRWFPAGSSVEEGDVNSPSAESILRQFLYGNEFFRREFHKASAEYMLPDCFGFPASLPSLLAHAGIKGFSTQKLTWGSAAPVGGPGSPENTPVGTPFNVGIWEGPDGRSVLAALNPGSYGSDITHDLSKSNPPPTPADEDYVDWPKRVELDGQVSGVFADYHYYGTGDVGGAPEEASVKLLEAIVTKGTAVLPPPRNPHESYAHYQQRLAETTGPLVTLGDGPLHVVSATSDQMFLDIKPDQTARLPRYRGDLELTNHSAGSLSSEAYHKRWNRKNELLAAAAERASVVADWLGGRRYPLERMNRTWRLVMGGQFHDIMAGTATPKAYEFSWNDDVLAMNQFAGILTSATQAIASALDTQSKGIPIVVYNPLNIAREDVVEANVSFRGAAPKGARAFGPDGREVPAQILGTKDGITKILFLAKAPSVGFAVYDVRASTARSRTDSLKVSQSSVENARYRIKLDQNGDVSSIFDKSIDKELLSSPIRLAFQTEAPHDWPAWNMDWDDQKKPPRSYIQGPAKIRITENGPVRVALEVERESEGSHFVETIRLSAGDAGNRVEFGNVIDWKTHETALKATFPLTASNPDATYNWDVGTIQRANNNEKKFEVPSHQWFDLTDKSGAYGVTVLSDCKYGSDKPDDSTLRLTLLYTPGLGKGNGRDYSDQTTQDWGHHEFLYGLASHAMGWRQGGTDWQAYRLNQPLIAFESSKHPGALGTTFSLLGVNNNRVRVLALKKAEQSDEIIVRVVEMSGSPQKNVRLSFAAPIIAAREVTGQEMALGDATVSDGQLVTELSPYQLRSFAIKMGAAPDRVAPLEAQPVTLSFDRAVASTDGSKSIGGFDSEGRALPAEMLPSEIAYAGFHFELAPAETGKPDALVPRGQSISLPSGKFNRLYILAASADGDQKCTFLVGEEDMELVIQNWTGFIGQWDDRTWSEHQEPIPRWPGAPPLSPGTPPRMRTVEDYTGLIPGFIKRAPVAWFASHRHTAEGVNEPYAYSYLFAYVLDLPANAKTVVLPNNDNVRILAMTAVDEEGDVQPAQPLYDVLPPRPAL
ncbi:MAG: glycoside hydrolase family 38 C-terminal domain-containing protein [Candidatus Acidiferrum sp.]